MDEDIVIPIAGMVVMLVLTFGLPLTIAHVRRSSRRDREDPEAHARLERMEHAIDAMAVEMERIAEGQRYVTQLLAGRLENRHALPAPHERRQS